VLTLPQSPSYRACSRRESPPVLIRVQWRLSCGLEDHLIEHAESRFLAGAVEPVFRDATAQGLQLPAVRLLVFLHQCRLPSR